MDSYAVTDVVMPQMSGVVLAQRLAETRPEMKVLCMSGYADQAALRHGVIDSKLAFLDKPLTPTRLLRRVPRSWTASDHKWPSARPCPRWRSIRRL
jgi:FixJ family two-component response regulator